MFISKGSPNPSEPWRILEVAIGQSPDVLALRLAKEFKVIHEKAIEALIPFRRNSEGQPEWITEMIFIRGANGSIRSLARIPGIDCVRKETAPPYWIKKLIELEKPAKQMLKCGDFVRVLSGICARMCGDVQRIEQQSTTVSIALRTKIIRLYTYQENLQLIDCDPSEKVFFYRPSLFS